MADYFPAMLVCALSAKKLAAPLVYWYTGFTGPKYNQERQELEFLRDTPDVQATFSIQIYSHKIRIRARDHQAQSWLAEWEV